MNSSGRAKGPYGRQGMRNRGEYGGGGGPAIEVNVFNFKD